MSSDPRPVHKWWTLVAATASLFLIMLDTTIVNVALPAIQSELALDLVELEWTVNAFLLAYAAFLLTGGKLADFFGRRAIFLIGLVVFTASSLACGIADSGGVLIAARAVQGLGAALMLPATQGMIAATFAPRERGMAYGIWGGVSMIGLSLGPLVGGILVDKLDWRWIFYVNVPFGVLAVVFTIFLVRESKDLSADQRLDFAGLITSGLFLVSLVFALVEGNNYGWTSWQVLTAFAVAALSLAVFVIAELSQRRPMLDLSFFRNGTFAGANVAALMIMLSLLGVLFFFSIYLQNLLGYSAIETGASFLPLTLLVMFVSPISGKLSDSIGPKWPITLGLALFGVGLVSWSSLDLNSGFYDLLPGLIVGGIGIGLAMPPLTTAAVGALPVDRAGVASGVVNTFRQAGGARGVAIMGAILLSSVGDAQPGTPDFARGFIVGLEDAVLLGAAFCALGSIVAYATIGKLEPHTEEALAAEPALAELVPHPPAPTDAGLGHPEMVDRAAELDQPAR